VDVGYTKVLDVPTAQSTQTKCVGPITKAPRGELPLGAYIYPHLGMALGVLQLAARLPRFLFVSLGAFGLYSE
jgi:hypothetical protein